MLTKMSNSKSLELNIVISRKNLMHQFLTRKITANRKWTKYLRTDSVRTHNAKEFLRLSSVINMFSFLSLEPVVFLVQFGRYVLEGAQIQTDLLMWKICHLEKNYSESICSNLTLDEYDDINTMVQTRANNLLMVMQWLHSG